LTLAQHLSLSTQWGTPKEILIATAKVLGVIDLDPASSLDFNDRVGAGTYYSLEAGQDGLILPWFGRVFLNPPYGRGISCWTEKLISCYDNGEIVAAIAVLPAATSSRWFQPLFRFPIAFPSKRLAFVDPTGLPGKGGNPGSSAVVYLGTDTPAFRDHFSSFGAIVERIK